jgi:hypothetical protein
MFIYVDYVYLILLFLTSSDMVKKKISLARLFWDVDITNMTIVHARHDQLHEELDFRTTCNNDDTL